MTDSRNGFSARLRSLVPKSLSREVMRTVRRYGFRSPFGSAQWGDLRRLEPFSREWGFDRGKPIDRFYIEKFLGKNSHEIRGRVLEIGTDRYTRLFGGDKVVRGDVLHVSESKPKVTIVADLTQPDQFPVDEYDCVILTSTLQFIYDQSSAVSTVHKILKPSGVLLVTVPGISCISRYDFDRWGEFWRFTTLSLLRTLEDAFPGGEVEVEGHGNVLASAAFLYGLAAEELREDELNRHDPDYQLLVCGRAKKAPAES